MLNFPKKSKIEFPSVTGFQFDFFLETLGEIGYILIIQIPLKPACLLIDKEHNVSTAHVKAVLFSISTKKILKVHCRIDSKITDRNTAQSGSFSSILDFCKEHTHIHARAHTHTDRHTKMVVAPSPCIDK